MDHEIYIKRCYELAVRAGRKGFDTFGAILVHNGQVLEEAENTADWDKGIFGHAEFNLVHQCANRYPDAVLKESTLYTSCAPCERCLCAIASLGVENIVFGVGYEAFSQLTPGEASMADREGLLRELGIRMRLTGPILENEGMRVFEWWGGEYRPLEELIAEMAEVKARQKETADTCGKRINPQAAADGPERAAITDAETVATLACELWPDHTVEEMTAEFRDLLTGNEAAVFLFRTGGEAVGFAQCQLRHDYVEGTESSPVGYLEGIYVRESYRKKGIARRLLKACEEWSGEHGCREFASDCELTNTVSQEFHQAVGFEEANRIVAYVRKVRTKDTIAAL